MGRSNDEGDANVACAWRLGAHGKGYAGVRLEELKGS